VVTTIGQARCQDCGYIIDLVKVRAIEVSADAIPRRRRDRHFLD
jgi:hypothetical protein